MFSVKMKNILIYDSTNPYTQLASENLYIGYFSHQLHLKIFLFFLNQCNTITIKSMNFNLCMWKIYDYVLGIEV